ncbi:MAG: sigma-70 family RNA polymerase sigma factor [Anaerolineae bacterium]|nr:sigma-70 family RNA polymerase sigma factor [Anaerolineae bacterium]
MTESDLPDRAFRLERDAFAQIFDRHYDAIFRYIYRRVGHRETAEDLAQEVFHRLVETNGRGGRPIRNVKAWLYRVARNLVIDEARRQTVRQHEPLEDTHPQSGASVSQQADQEMMTATLLEAMGKLTRKQKEVIELKFLQSLTTREVADVLRISERGVLKLQQRGVAALRTQLVLSNVLAREIA